MDCGRVSYEGQKAKDGCCEGGQADCQWPLYNNWLFNSHVVA